MAVLLRVVGFLLAFVPLLAVASVTAPGSSPGDPAAVAAPERSAASAAAPPRPAPSVLSRSAHGAFPLGASFHAPHLAADSRALTLAGPKGAAADTAAKPAAGGREQIAWPVTGELRAKASAARTPTWSVIEGGVVGWIRIRSDGAAALRVGLRVRTPEGSVFTVTGDGDATLGIPPQRVGDVQFEAASATLVWTPVTSGATQSIEVYLPGARSIPPRDAVVVEDLSHFVVNPLEPEAAKRDVGTKLQACHVNYDCLSAGPLRTAGRAVAKLVITTSEGSFFCSGALLTDRDDSGTPYFATADHCDVTTRAVAASVQFVWNYEQRCNQSGTNPGQATTVGATLLYSDRGNDFTLLRVAGPLPGGLVLLGWDPREQGMGDAVDGVHHPAGARKAYSRGGITAIRTVSMGSGADIKTVPVHTVTWRLGLTEGGSSGSPLLSADGLFLGTLWSGNRDKVCGGENYSNYSRFNRIFKRASAWLDPASNTEDDWANSAAETQGAQPASFDTVSQSGRLERTGDEDWFRFTFFEPGTWIVVGEDYGGATTDTVGRIFAADGLTMLAENDDDPFASRGLHFAFHNKVTVPGTYYVQVTGYEGATGPYALSSVFVPADDHSDSLLLGTPVPLNGSLAGGLSRDGDLDAFVVDLPTAGTLTVGTTGSTDVMGALYASDGSKLDFNDDAQYPDNLNFRISRTLPAGRYFVAVVGFDPSARGSYTLAATFAAAGTAGTTTAVEFRHAGFDHYFLTSLAAEISALDSGALGGWSRTGRSFKVFQLDSPGAANVCRFFSDAFAPRSSHFYTPLAGECATVKGNADWRFEGEVFALALPDAIGNCAGGTVPLYRLYNDGRSGAPNHRYTVDSGVRTQMIALGWLPEGRGPLGVIGCAPQ